MPHIALVIVVVVLNCCPNVIGQDSAVGNGTTNHTSVLSVYEVSNYINLCTTTLGAIGNVFVLVASTKTWHISVHYKLTAALGVSDLLFCVIYFIYIIQMTWSKTWVYPRVFCKIFEPILSTTVYIDIGFIVIIALERYASICYAMRGGFSNNVITWFIAINVMSALVSASPLAVVIEHGDVWCFESWSGTRYAKSYSIYLLTVYFLVPLTFLSVLYFKSVATLQRVRRTLTCSNSMAKTRKDEENKRILYIVCCLVLSFFVLVLPSWLCWIILDYVEVKGKGRDFIDGFSSLTFPLHALCNPIIYSLVDKKVRGIIFGKRNNRIRRLSNGQTTKTSYF